MIKSIKHAYAALNAWVEGEPLPTRDAAPEQPSAHEQPQLTFIEGLNEPDSRATRWLFHGVCIAICAIFSAIMLFTVSELPTYGMETNPTTNALSEHYIEAGIAEVGATNLVTNVILVYRGFDTYAESCVLFLAATCVIMLLKRDKNNNTAKDDQIRQEDAQIEAEEGSLLLRSIVRFLMPIGLLFGFYILFNGHISPGGGFAGGSIIGAMMILCDNALGTKKVNSFFNDHIYHIIKIGALLLYAVLIGYTIFVGANGLTSIFGTGTAGSIFSGGITLPINVAVGLEVACTMYAFYAFFSKGEL